jgi:hypothetical protein
VTINCWFAQVISGQSLSTNHGSNVYVEVEVVGIPTDTVKGKTRQSQRNAFNPIWNEEFNYRVSPKIPGCFLARFESCECPVGFFQRNSLCQIYGMGFQLSEPPSTASCPTPLSQKRLPTLEASISSGQRSRSRILVYLYTNERGNDWH